METPPEIEIRDVPVSQVIDLRHRVLRAGLPRESAHFAGDENGMHFAALLEGRAVGCCTLMPSRYDGKAALQLRGMAVEPSMQRSGIGAKLLAEAEHHARRRKVGIIWANCRMPAVPFYQRNGWKIVGEEFVVETAGPHFQMMRYVGGAEVAPRKRGR